MSFALKAELGDIAGVVYEKPCEDRKGRLQERREALAGGAVIDQPKREVINCAASSEFAARVAVEIPCRIGPCAAFLCVDPQCLHDAYTGFKNELATEN